jgi:uncharacterized membrane protein YhaH (DUF805 family)
MNKNSYFYKIGYWRLNRAGYIAGTIVAAFLITALFVISYSLLSKFVDISTALAISLPILIIEFYFIASFTIRRLHDLNKSGYLVIILLPNLILPTLILALLLIMKSSFEASPIFLAITNTTSNGIYTIYNFICSIFWLYVTFWPGTKGNNKYGFPSTHWTIKEIFGFAKPASTGYAGPTTNPVKPLLKILIGLMLFFLAFLAIIFAIIFIKRLMGI